MVEGEENGEESMGQRHKREQKDLQGVSSFSKYSKGLCKTKGYSSCF